MTDSAARASSKNITPTTSPAFDLLFVGWPEADGGIAAPDPEEGAAELTGFRVVDEARFSPVLDGEGVEADGGCSTT